MMKQVTYTDFKKNLISITEDIEINKNIYKIIRRNHSNIIIIPESDYSEVLDN